jgi:hypothetical protein
MSRDKHMDARAHARVATEFLEAAKEGGLEGRFAEDPEALARWRLEVARVEALTAIALALTNRAGAAFTPGASRPR